MRRELSNTILARNWWSVGRGSAGLAHRSSETPVTSRPAGKAKSRLFRRRRRLRTTGGGGHDDGTSVPSAAARRTKYDDCVRGTSTSGGLDRGDPWSFYIHYYRFRLRSFETNIRAAAITGHTLTTTTIDGRNKSRGCIVP